MNTTPSAPQPDEEQSGRPRQAPLDEGTNRTQHVPDPRAEPMEDGQRKHVPRSPYTHGND